MYLWILSGAYLLAFVTGFFLLSQRARAEADQMVARGLDSAAVDQFYASAGLTALVALVQITAVTGTLIGCLGSIIWWLVTK